MSMLPVRAEGKDADEIAAVLAARQATLSLPKDGSDAEVRPMLTFTLGDVAHALPVADIRSVARIPPVTAVPHAPAALAGLVAWRGTIANLFDPGVALGFAPTSGSAMLVLRHPRPQIALRVDTLLGVIDLPMAAATSETSLLVDGPNGRVNRLDTVLLIAKLLGTTRFQEG